MDPDPLTPAIPDVTALFGVVLGIIVIGIVVTIAITIRNASKAINSGHNPLTVEYDLALAALSSEALAPKTATEEKLAEIERLYAANLITADEREAARVHILGAI